MLRPELLLFGRKFLSILLFDLVYLEFMLLLAHLHHITFRLEFVLRFKRVRKLRRKFLRMLCLSLNQGLKLFDFDFKTLFLAGKSFLQIGDLVPFFYLGVDGQRLC